MGFTTTFFLLFVKSIWYGAPLLILFGSLICLLGLWTGRQEGWNRGDALYYAFITATTVGYGDLRPTKRKTKCIAVAIAFCGLLFTGIIVAIAVNCVTLAYKEAYL